MLTWAALLFMFSSQIVLSLSAIPLSLNLLQYISAEKSFGRLVIILFEMLSEMMGFMWVFLLCIVGFSITFWGLFNHTGPYGFRGLGFTFLQLLSVTTGSLNYPLIQVCVSAFPCRFCTASVCTPFCEHA